MEAESRKPGAIQGVILRRPVAEDGAAVHDLISRSAPLDTNSLYCNLLQCTHFSDTCVVAEQDGDTVGFASAYLLPGRSDTLFIWQIAVDGSARGRGLAKRMLLEILGREICRHVSCLETTINPDNAASWRLFGSLAEQLNASCGDTLLFDREKHFKGRHADEKLLQISSESGPFTNYLQTIQERQP